MNRCLQGSSRGSKKLGFSDGVINRWVDEDVKH